MKPKSILFIMKGGASWIGGAYYIKNLIQSTEQYAKKNSLNISINLLLRDSHDLIFFNDIKSKINKIFVDDTDLKDYTIYNRIKWFLKRKLTTIFNPRLDEFIIKNNFDFVYPALPRKTFEKYRFAEWIPDFQYHHYPEGSNQIEISERINEFNFICKNSPLVYLSSFHAQKDCHSLFPDSIGKTEVMHFCAFQEPTSFKSPIEDILQKYSISKPYFIVSNLLAPTKNHTVIIKAIRILRDLGYPITVISTGDLHDYRNPTFKNQILNEINHTDTRNNFILMGLIPRDEQKFLMLNSIAIIQPSRFEGWNTSVEEAKSIGKLIVLSDIEVHLEQSPDDAKYFKDNDAESLADILLKLSKSHDSKEEIQTSLSMTPSYIENINSFAKKFLEKSLDINLN